jgi:predicted nucleic acid-binding protein
VSDFSYDSNIVIDALNRVEGARQALRLADRAWINRICWIEIMSKMVGPSMRATEEFLSHFWIEEVDARVSERAAALRRERPRLKLPDALIFASAQVHGRILMTRNIKEFPANTLGVRVPYTIEQG